MLSLRPLTLLGGLLVSAVLAQAQAPIPAKPTFDSSDPQVYGKQLMTYADRYDSGWKDEVSSGSMRLFDAGGDSVLRTYTRLALERPAGNKYIIRFKTPAEIKGVGALTHENPNSSDDNWLYLPATRRVRRISGANNTASFQGTEFTYEDLSAIDPVEYEWRFLAEETLKTADGDVPTYKIQGIPTYANTGYTRLVIWIHREHWRRERVDYYDKASRHLKTLTASGWHRVHGRFWRNKRLEMKNLQTKKRTVLDVPKLFLDLARYKSRSGKPRKNLSESLFTSRALAK